MDVTMALKSTLKAAYIPLCVCDCILQNRRVINQVKAVKKDGRDAAKTKQYLKPRESTIYTHMWKFAEVSDFCFTVLRV